MPNNTPATERILSAWEAHRNEVRQQILMGQNRHAVPDDTFDGKFRTEAPDDLGGSSSRRQQSTSGESITVDLWKNGVLYVVQLNGTILMPE